MVVTEFGIVNEVNPLQPEKIKLGITFTLLPIFTVVKLVQPINHE